MTRDDRLLELSDNNLAEFAREQARFLQPSYLEERESALFTSSGTRFPAGASNCVMMLGPKDADPQRTLERARAWFDALGRGFSVYVRAHRDEKLGQACERAGYARLSDPPGMALSERVESRELAPHVRVREVRDDETATGFVHVSAAAFESIGMPPDVTRKIFSEPRRWLSPHWHVEVVYERDEPVAGAMLLFSHGVAGAYWVGTVPSARGRGHADAVMRSVSNRAFDRGAAAVVLQATPFGEPVYKRLGYREITRYPWYLALRESAKSVPPNR